ncbi:MAG: D-alanyl-D-alanine carboxypeptidase family protein [Pseudoflavonifractor sp.]
MKRLFAAFFAVLFLCAIPAQGALHLSATSSILVDGETGRVLFAQNAHEERAIASITKLMTALVAVRSAPDLSRVVTVLREDTLTEGSSMYLTPGEEITAETLLYGLLLVSGNDAALTLARDCAGDVATFVTWMNRCADELGMEHTHFSNPNGLADEDNYSTAADMAKLACAVMEDALLCKIVSTKSITVETRTLVNHNKLLWRYEGCVGMKTGYTDRAGRTLVSCANRDGQRLIAVTLNAPDDWRDHAALLDYGYARWQRSMLALAGRQCRRLPVTGSLVRFVTVSTARDVYYLLSEGEQVRAEVKLPEMVEAPVRAGAIAGSLDFYLGTEQIGRTYLLYDRTVLCDRPRDRRLLDRVLDFFGQGKSASFLAAFYSEIKL